MTQKLALDFRSIFKSMLIALIFAVMLLRLLYLDQAPPGLYIDETLPAAHAICISQTGADLDNLRGNFFHSPLFFGETSPVPTLYVYPLSLWIKLFGADPNALRSFSALLGVITIAGIFLIARRLCPSSAIWAVLLATISPWSFMLFRMAWEVVVYPFLIVWVVYFWLRKEFLCQIFSILLMILALYAYPPARIFVPLLLVNLVVFKFTSLNRTENFKSIFFMLGLFLLAALPAYQIFSDASLRFMQMSIFNRDWLISNFGASNVNSLLWAFLTNLGLHLSPSFLVMQGDINPRHGLGVVGEWSWPEIAGIIIFVIALLSTVFSKYLIALKSFSLQNYQIKLGLFLLCSFIAALIPAALTTEGLPHALRASSAWIFSTLLAAVGVSLIKKSLILEAGLIILSGYFVASFTKDYFFLYPTRSLSYFDQNLLSSTNSLSLNEFLFVHQGHNPKSKSYYLMHNYLEDCTFVRQRFDFGD